MKIKTLTIVGVGLIGGSVGLAAKCRGVAQRVLGVGRSLPNLERALEFGAIDEGFLDLAEGVHQAEVAVFCTPVDRIAEQVLCAAPVCAAGTLLTDAGSTKAAIVSSVEGRLPRGVQFVGSHPIAGSEKRGAEFADPDLFEGRLTIVTQTPDTDVRAVEQISAFWRALGARVHLMDPAEHDKTLALTSHLPHLVASALAATLPAELYYLTGTGFRDTTRISSGDPEVWSAIFAQNRDAVRQALDAFERKLARLRALLDASDWTNLHDTLAQAKKVRDALGS